MTESERRNKVIETARYYLGCKKGDSKHLAILAEYNSELTLASSRKRYKPETRTHKMTTSEAWCATFVSAIGLLCGEKDFPLECSCNQQIAQLKNMGEWVEDDAYIPTPGDLIYYDWDDTGAGDNTNKADHVGIIEKVQDNTMTIIEGNKNNACARRTVKINGRYIRGFGHIKYSGSSEYLSQSSPSVPDGNTFKSYTATVIPSNGLNIRSGPGTNYKKLGVLKCKTSVTVTKEDDGWCYIGTGWVCGEYLKKV